MTLTGAELITNIPWREFSKYWEVCLFSTNRGAHVVYRRTPAGFENARPFIESVWAYEVENVSGAINVREFTALEFLCWLAHVEAKVLSSTDPRAGLTALLNPQR